MNTANLDVLNPSASDYARTFLERLHRANHGSRGKDRDLQDMLTDNDSFQPDIPIVKTVDRHYSLRIEMSPLSQGLEPKKEAERFDLHSILCSNSFSCQPHLDGDENLRFLDCGNSDVNLSVKDRVSAALLPSIFLPLGSIIEEARSLNNRFEYRHNTNYRLLWNLSTQPTSLWMMYDYYDIKNYDMGLEWNCLNHTTSDEITLQEKKDALQFDNMRQRKLRALENEACFNENLSWIFESEDAWDLHADKVYRTAAEPKTITIDDYNQVNVVKLSQAFKNTSSSIENWDFVSRLSKSARSTPIKYRPSNSLQVSFINPFVMPRVFDIPKPFDLAMVCSDIDQWCCDDSKRLDILSVQRCIQQTHYLMGDGLRAARTQSTWVEETDRRANLDTYQPETNKTSQRAKL